ncbi:hypothetical protein Bca52824_082264 [Brassica carinata]|uniref:Uncharacterized protein n=1 Tax=Brassica carinata TaxID=52824 RepID=A0A8X7PKA0_BRACI|nr:hypothetical protein Bca52824_082264 [Brassica carinata]
MSLLRPVSIAIPAGGTCKASDNSASSAGDRTLNDEVDSLTHRRRRRVMEEINTVTSGSSSSRLPPPLRVSGEGTSRINSGARLSSVPEASSWVFSYDNEIPILENPDSLAAIWRKIRAEGSTPFSGRIARRDTYVRMAMEASNEYAALMERRLANFASNKLQLIFLSIVYVCSTGGSFTHPWFPWFPWFNKGIAFTMTERDRLLPSSAMDSEHQIQRSMTDLKRMEEQARDGLSDPNALAKWRILLQDRTKRNVFLALKIVVE